MVLHQNRYKRSVSVNESGSSAEGRRANTFDGERHWRDQTYFLTDSALSWRGVAGAGQALVCDHVLDQVLTADRFAADFDAGHTEVRVRPDGSRYTK